MLIPALRRFTLAVAAPALALGAGALAASAQVPGEADPFIKSSPRAKATHEALGGQRAVERMGANMDAIAKWYGKSGKALKRELLFDKKLKIDETGRLFVVEEMERPLATDARNAAGAEAIINGQLAPLTETFKLHSKPDSQRTLVLNFQGAKLQNTGWNRGVPTITAKPFDIDGNANSFSELELQRIQYIWQRVAEDFAPFDLNVTTELVAQDRLVRSSTADQVYGGTILITHNQGVYSCSCGGVAYVRGFGNPGYNTGLAFPNMLANSEKNIAEAVSHEAGHLLGLLHDGSPSGAYYYGQGSGAATGWAPIMGVGYQKPLVQWSKGEYANANNKEDDIAIMQQFAALRADEAGDTPQTAALLQPTVTNGVASATAQGLIGRQGDRDLYRFTASPGSITAAVTPAARSPNADLVLTLLSDTGAVITSANPAAALNASITFQILRPGTYYLQVSSTGLGNPQTDGYTDYGSLGNYRLTASYTPQAGTPPVAALSVTPASGAAPLAVRLDASASRDDGEVRFVYWTFGDGTADETGTLRVANRTYRTPGSYTVGIRVVDNMGLSSTASQVITVTPGPATQAERTLSANVTLAALSMGGNSWAAQGALFVTDQSGARLANAAVNYSWSGLIQGTRTATSQAQGTPLLSLASSQKGCFVLTVTGVTLAGYAYRPPSPVSAQICR